MDDELEDEIADAYELLNMDIHEVSVVDRTANDTEWLMMKRLGATDFGDFAIGPPTPRAKKNEAQTQGAPALPLDPTIKTTTLAKLGDAIKALEHMRALVEKSAARPGEQLPAMMHEATRLIAKHLLTLAASSPELEELMQVGKAISASPTQVDAEAVALAKNSIETAIAEIAKRDRTIAELRAQVSKLSTRIQPPGAAHPERSRTEKTNTKPALPYMFRAGHAVGPGE